MSRTALSSIFAAGLLTVCYFSWGYYRIERFIDRKEAIPAWPLPVDPSDPRVQAEQREWKEFEEQMNAALKSIVESGGESVPQKADNEQVIDIGYILKVYAARDFWNGEKRIVWYVKVPTTDKIYVCEWLFGSSEFSTNDSVKLIHDSDLEEIDEGGRLIGMHGRLQGKVASVAVNDLDELL